MLFEKLSEKDTMMMARYIDNYAMNGNVSRTASIDHIMRVWDEAKSEYLYKMLGEQFMVTKEITIVKDRSQLMSEIDYKVTGYRSDGRPFYEAVSKLADKYYVYRGWNDTLTTAQEESSKISRGLYDLINIDALTDNIYNGTTFTLVTADNKKIVVNNGCKVMRVLGKIAEAFNLPGFEEFRIAHSMCFNEKYLHGNLVLSIHPLDYMTMSDNANNWGSCMSWTDYGEYRRGTVEMMNSPMVVCAYLLSDERFSPCYNVNWNSKKWRELFIVTPATIAGIKGYPYWNRDIERQVIMIIRQLAQDNLGWGPYNCEPTTFKPGDFCHIDEFNKDYTFSFYTSAMYCDFYDKHQAIVSHNAPTHMDIGYSGFSECMCCGGVHGYFDCESDLICEDCDITYHCCDCGDRHDRDNLYEIDGDLFCEYCVENLPTCDSCGSTHLECNMTQVHVANKEGLCRHHYVMVCDDCWDHNHFFDADDVKTIRYSWGRCYYYVDVENCSDDMLDHLGLDDPDDINPELHGFVPFNSIT